MGVCVLGVRVGVGVGEKMLLKLGAVEVCALGMLLIIHKLPRWTVDMMFNATNGLAQNYNLIMQ